MTEQERLAMDFKSKAEYCHIAWRAYQLSQTGAPRKTEAMLALWTRFTQAFKELHAAYTALNEQNPKNPLGPLE